MIKRICPKCKAICDLDENEVSLGSAKCKCGASIEVLSVLSHTEPSQPKIPEPVKDTSDPKPKPPSQTFSNGPETAGSNISEPPSPGMVTRGKFDRRYLWPFLFILISLGIVYGLWKLNWITVLMVVSIISTAICWWAKKESKKDLDKKGATNKFAYFFFDKCLEFFVPLTLVVIFYRILSWFIDANDSDTSTISSLEGLQSTLDSFLYYLSWIKFKPWIAALIIFGVILLDLFLSIFFSYKDLASYYKQYSLWTKRVFTTVFLLCCFTFFGAAVGEKRAELSNRVDRITNGYSRVHEKASEMLTDAVQEKLYEKVQNSLPPDLRADAYLIKITERLGNLEVNVHYAKAANVNVEAPSALIERYKTFNPESIRYGEAPSAPESPRPSARPPVKPPASVSVQSVERVISEIETKPGFKQRLASLIKSGGGKQLFCQFPKSFTNAVKSAVFQAAVEKYPIIEPITEVFVGTFDKAVEEKVNSSTERVAETILKNPSNVNNVIAEESTKIVNSVETKASPAALERIKQTFDNITPKFNEIDVASNTLEKQTQAAINAESEKAIAGNSADKGKIRNYICRCGARVIWGPKRLPYSMALLLCPEGAPCL